MVAGRTMGFTIVEGFFVSYHTTENPSDSEWQDQLEFCAGKYKGLKGVLVWSDGGGPSSLQRSQLAESFRDAPPAVAMITESAIVRGMLTALSWFGLKQRAFRPSDMDKALAFLGVNSSESELIRK